MSLEDLNKQVYSRGSGPEKKETGFLGVEKKVDSSSADVFLREETWQKEEKGLTAEGKRKLKIISAVLGVVLLISSGVFAFFTIRKNAFNEDKVGIFFEGPTEAESTKKVRYELVLRNANKVDLNGAEVIFSYADNFQPDPLENGDLKILSSGSSKISLGSIKAGSEKRLVLNGIFYAPKDSPMYLKAKLLYSPGNYSNKYEVENQYGVNIKSSPVFIEATAPVSATSGDTVAYVVDYRNLDVRPLQNSRIRIVYPGGFEFVSSEPEPSENDNSWYLGDFPAGESGKIIVKGKLSGSKDEGKTVQALIGKIGLDGNFITYGKSEKNTKMSEPPLSVVQAVLDKSDKIANAGEELRYVVRYKNSGETSLRNVVITMHIESKILDVSKMVIGNGHFDSRTGVITWKSSEVPQLANLPAGAGGELGFSVPVLSILPFAGEIDMNQVIMTQASISSTDVLDPEGANRMISSEKLTLKVATKTFLEVGGFRKHPSIENFGPMPMKLGEETSFVMRWGITNISNEIGDVVVTSSLPSGVKWTGKINPSEGDISYNERTNEVVWKVGKVGAGTGIVQPGREISFQISITPQPNDVGKFLKLLNPTIMVGKDLFTEKSFSLEHKEKNTILTEDESIDSADYKVR